MTWLLDNVGAALIGAIVATGIAVIAARVRAESSSRSRQRYLARDSGPNQERTNVFLQAVSPREERYRPTDLDLRDVALPLLATAKQACAVDIRAFDEVLELESLEIDPLPEDDRVIQRRQSRGTELWNGDLIYVTGADFSRAMPRLRVRRSFYFAYVTKVDRVVSKLWSRHPETAQELVDYHSLSNAFAGSTPSLWVSAAVSTLIDQGTDDPIVVIHRRSDSVVNAPGVRTVAPVFGCDAATIGTARSRLGLLLYNVAREYTEEHFNKEEIVQANRSNWHHPDQIIQAFPELRNFLDDIDDGLVTVLVTGMSVNPKDADLSLAVLIRVSSESRSAQDLQRMHAGWEAAPSEKGDPAVELVSLFDDRLDAWVREGQLYPTSAYSLDRARAITRLAGTVAD